MPTGLPDKAVLAGHDLIDRVEHEEEDMHKNEQQQQQKGVGLEGANQQTGQHQQQDDSKLDKVKDAMNMKK